MSANVLSWIRERVERERELDRASGIYSGRVEGGEFVYAAVAELIEADRTYDAAVYAILAATVDLGLASAQEQLRLATARRMRALAAIGSQP